MKSKNREIVGQMLVDAGYVPDGITDVHAFRVVTKNSYPFAGAEIKIGGRERFKLPDTNKRVTLGRMYTCFYILENKSVKDFKNFKTNNIEGIKEWLQNNN